MNSAEPGTVRPASSELAELAGQILAARQRRHHFFDSDMFGEPSWDMILNIYVQFSKGHQKSITELASDARLPLATAIRWIHKLAGRGLVTLSVEPTDTRRYNVLPTNKVLYFLEEYLMEMRNARV